MMAHRYAFPQFDTLENPYVAVTPLSTIHAPELWRAIEGEDDEFFTHLFFGPFRASEEVQHWVEETVAVQTNVPAAIFSKRLGSVVGSCALINIDCGNGSAEIGSIFCGGHARGTEVVPATVQVLLQHLIGRLGYRRVVWKCDTRNLRSRRAAERLGFVYEGTFRNHMFIKGRSRDTSWYSIIDADYLEAMRLIDQRLRKKAGETTRR
jgi:RimJ/RimL family protein N-acetyltransferase